MSRIYDEVDSGYAEACSDVTVCSNKKGFFKDLANEVVSIAESTGFLNTFDEIDERSKVKAVMGNETAISVELWQPSKSSDNTPPPVGSTLD
ncbi:unnamed protein product [Pieris macdunnoughi]|uniref:Uncharacterized protein n=1 Tax=Pieris macdunnoughi TaxID=345717 RepID=A0A821L0V6_9NEOP|nr:unnamed protein product [Pieris macdunnoughi]